MDAKELTDDALMSAIKSVCDFDAERAEKWRPEALAIGRAVERAVRAHTPQPTTPRSTAEQIDAVFRRNLDLLIQNLTVDSDNKITWMSIVCRGVEQSLYPLASKRVTHYQQLLGVAHVVLGCLVANGVDIPERFLDAFGDPDSVESPLELLPCDFLPAQAVGAAVQQAAPVAWSVYNGVCLDQIFMLRESADKYAANMQKSHDLSGSLAAFVVKPLYAAPQG